ncbi:MAG: pkb-activating kinase-like protein [Bathelium mastoideum]|nr:MAG: pkb-activating kinase-like protein [Bathelium mastoideum]
MNGDISLSQSLGGLRIANPDDEGHKSPSPPPVSALGTAEQDTSSIHPSSDIESTQSQSLLAVQSIDDSDSNSLGFNANEFSLDTPTPSQAPMHSPFLTAPDHQSTPATQLSRRRSMPLGNKSQQSIQPPQPSPITSQPRNNPPVTFASSRPVSGIYSHPNLSSSSGVSSQGSYRYRDDLQAASVPAGIGRNTSRRQAPALQGIYSGRERSGSERSYREGQQPGMNGPFPPRRSSRRVPVASVSSAATSHPIPSSTSQYVEGGPLPSSEEWRDKGAAVGVRREVDASGRPVTRVVKKGVKDFEFGRTLGEGSYSTVLAATDRQTGREYAIKVLDKRHIIKEKKVKYVNIEKDTLNRLGDHPGVVRLYYTFQDERSLYFVLDLATGGELLSHLKKMTTFDIECARFYSAEILDAVDYMHTRGIIHRDLKPENVLLDDKMHVKITDFGTAKILDLKPASSSNESKYEDSSEDPSGSPMDGAETDRAVSFVGTAEYVSPELLTDKNACKASDLWALGCIIYQLLAGRPPFKGTNEYQTFQKIVALDYAFPVGFPDVARDLVERLLVLDPAKRLPIEHIKNHQFFDGVRLGKELWQQRPPKLRSYVPPAQEPIRLNGNGTVQVTESGAAGTPRSAAPPNTLVAGGSLVRPQLRAITELPPPSQLDIDWSPVLTRTNERILKLGNLIITTTPAVQSPTLKHATPAEAPKKFSRFFGPKDDKKKQRLVMITSSARIILAAAGGEEKKAKMEIPLLAPGTSWTSYKDSRGITVWCIDTREKHHLFEDPKATPIDSEGSKYTAQEWLDILERAKEFAITQNITNSYSGGSAINDLDSAISSPASTIGADGALEAVNVPRSNMRRDFDAESSKSRKRFSKRHSKNGLAAVF